MNEEEINLVTIKPYVAKKGALNVPKKYVDEKSFVPSNQEDTGRSGCCNSGCCKSDNSCTHWGLKHWFCGIKEYFIDRCLCCGYDAIDGDRAYIKEENRGYNIVTTDCLILANDYHFDGWICGTLCLPFATLTHLMCLPVACCYPTKDDWWGTEAPRIREIVKKHKDERETDGKLAREEIEKRRAMTPEERKNYDLEKSLIISRAYVLTYAPGSSNSILSNTQTQMNFYYQTGHIY